MKKYRDPVTGDDLTSSEHASWVVQGLIRNWWTLGIITFCTIIVWSTTNPQALSWWNYAASYLALLIEGTVGIAMFSQTRRDAVILREVRDHARTSETILAHVESLVEVKGET